MTPLDTTRALFACFAQGDVPAILERLHPEVLWEYGVVANDVPWYQQRRGRTEVAGFFASLAALTWHRFEPKTFLAQDRLVVVLLDADYTVTATGGRVVYEDAVMLWRFDAGGLVTHFAHRVDTHQAWLACRAP